LGADETAVSAAVEAAIGKAPGRIERLHGGANNQVLRIEAGSRPLVAKRYFTHPGDPRDRLGTEFGMLSFLWARGVRQVPEPVAMDREHGIGVYG
jgi:Phosphotransferase enzyme family